jgi:hypothetical protein
MIIVRIMGGMGNQLFQYALGRNLSIRNNTELKLDISEYKLYKLHEYKLHHFNIKGNIATAEEVRRIKPSRLQVIDYAMYKIRRKFYPLHMQKVIEQRDFSYDRDVFKIKDNCYLFGYWQSEKYFKDIPDIIRTDFTLKNAPDEQNLKMLEKIKNVNSVSLHIRRGDYISNPETFKVHNILEIQYYMKALKLIVEKVQNPEIFVFSDDILWARKNLESSLPLYFMDYNGIHRDYEDLRLMKNCKHHIIANSTFSWWGAWLCENPRKIVIAPQQWFNTDKRNTVDLLPETWFKI